MTIDLCVQYWSAVVYKAEVKFSSIKNYPDLPYHSFQAKTVFSIYGCCIWGKCTQLCPYLN